MTRDLVKGTLGLGISFTFGIFSTTFPLPFVLDLVGVTTTDVSPAIEISFLEACSKDFFFISLFSCCNSAMTKWAFFNYTCSSMIRLSFSLGRFVFVKASGYSSSSCDMCMVGILLVVDLVTSLLGTMTTSGENWRFFTFILEC